MKTLFVSLILTIMWPFHLQAQSLWMIENFVKSIEENEIDKFIEEAESIIDASFGTEKTNSTLLLEFYKLITDKSHTHISSSDFNKANQWLNLQFSTQKLNTFLSVVQTKIGNNYSYILYNNHPTLYFKYDVKGTATITNNGQNIKTTSKQAAIGKNAYNNLKMIDCSMKFKLINSYETVGWDY